jgi:hypothetical protein
MKDNREIEPVMSGIFAVSVSAILLGIVVIINLSRMFYVATPGPATPTTSDYGYFEGSDPNIDPAFVTRSQPAHKPVEDQE